MLDDVRKYFKDRLEAISPQSAEDLSTTFVTMAQAAAEHLSGLAMGLMERSTEARAALVREVKELIAAQMEEMGVATKRDVATLRARLDRLEAKGEGGPPKSPPANKPSASARTRASARIPSARKPGPKKPSARKPASRSATPATSGTSAAATRTRGARSTPPRRPSGAH